MSLYFRLCPSCDAHQPPERLRCTCGAMLTGVDLRQEEPSAPPTPAPAPTPSPAHVVAPEPLLCPFEDCGQPNPPGTVLCLYCNRPLQLPGGVTEAPAASATSLVSLPSTLRKRFAIQRQLPASGAEAELFIVTPLDGHGPVRVAKVYRHGIHPKADVQARLARIPDTHKVQMLENGLSDGFAYELMEFCEAGSLRQLLQAEPLPPERLAELIIGLAAALRAVHAEHLIHRDLKPENLLLRRTEPLEVVLTDFGIASVQDATLRFTGSARTLAYGAPESLAGVIDAKADYWAMGMIVLEAVLGEHPFAGLSDAVLLHRLTTRAIDLGRVRDERLRMLLRGLLLRDPQTRWGAPDLQRWLNRDPTQTEPIEQGGSLGARQPYRIGEDECFTTDQLAVALARNWRHALADLDNGQIMNWLRVELQDHNSVRRLIELNEDRFLRTDVRLLRFLLHLAPGLPPVWRGQALSLGGVLTWAANILKGDAASAEQLLDVYQQKVIRIYAEAGHPELTDLQQRWQRAVEAFEADWQAAQATLAHHQAKSEYASFDDVLYGQVVGSARRPSPALLHARLLALSFDEGWTARLRRHLGFELQRLAPHVPWLQEMGDASACRPPRLLVLHALLPEAQRWIQQASRRQEDIEHQQRHDAEQLQKRHLALLQNLRYAAEQPFFIDPDACIDLSHALNEYDQHTEQVRGLSWPNPVLQRLRQRISRQESIIRPVRLRNEALIEFRIASQGFTRWPVNIAVGVLSILVMWLHSASVGYTVGLSLFIGIAVYVYGTRWHLVQALRKACDQLP